MEVVTETIDTRERPCACCQGDGFSTFDRLRPGEALELVADHNPTPLWYQLELRWTGEYRWRWLDAEEETWRVRIERHVFDGQSRPRFDVLPHNPGCPRTRQPSVRASLQRNNRDRSSAAPSMRRC